MVMGVKQENSLYHIVGSSSSTQALLLKHICESECVQFTTWKFISPEIASILIIIIIHSQPV